MRLLRLGEEKRRKKRKKKKKPHGKNIMASPIIYGGHKNATTRFTEYASVDDV